MSNYSSLVSVFLEEKSGKSRSLYKPITCYEFLHVTHFLADVLLPLATPSLSFQTKDLDCTEVHGSALSHSAIQSIESAGKASSSNLGKFRKAAPEEPQVGEDGTETLSFKDIPSGIQQSRGRKQYVYVSFM